MSARTEYIRLSRGNNIQKEIVTRVANPNHIRPHYTGTGFLENWRSDRKEKSDWYFTTRQQQQIYLRYGWTIFGTRTSSNHIIILDKDFHSSEIYILMSETPNAKPQVSCVNNNLLLNEFQLKPGVSYTMYANDILLLESGRKILLLKFMKREYG